MPSWRAIVMMVLKRPLYWAAAGPCTNTALPAFTATRARPSPCICNQLHTLVTNKLSKNQMDKWADRQKERDMTGLTVTFWNFAKVPKKGGFWDCHAICVFLLWTSQPIFTKSFMNALNATPTLVNLLQSVIAVPQLCELVTNVHNSCHLP